MYLTRNNPYKSTGIIPKYSNAIDLCFWNKECIEKREAAEAAAQQKAAEQQMLLQQLINKPTGGLSSWAIFGIVTGMIGLTFFTIFLIKRRKI